MTGGSGMQQILVCEDEAAIRGFVVLNLRRAGYTVLEAASGEAALELYVTHPTVAVALLDVMLPCMDGFEVCRRLRHADPTVGIVMLTARAQETEKIEGLHCGADDYVTKPFGIGELLARVEALCRRVRILRERNDSDRVQRGAFLLDMRAHTFTKNGKPIELTQMEYQILAYLFTHAGEPQTREAILREVWGEGFVGDDKVVDVNMRRLRLKLEDLPSEPRHLLTAWGKGYQWED